MKAKRKKEAGMEEGMVPTGHVTLKAIAKRAGVSLTTASFVLNGKGRIAQETRDRVMQIVRESHYMPNFHARAMLSCRTFLVGMLVPNIGSSFTGHVIGACSEELARNGYYLLIAEPGNSKEKEQQAFAFMMRLGVDGFIYAPPPQANEARPDGWRDAAAGKPLVSVLAELPGIPGVFTDHETGIRMIGECLLRKGHRKVAYFGPALKSGKNRANERFELLQNFFARQGETVVPFSDPAALIARRKEFTAVACFSDETAACLMPHLQAAGIRVPEDLSLTGYGHDLMVERLLKPQLTTVVEMKREVGTVAAQLLLSLLKAPQTGSPEIRRLPPTFREGASVRDLSGKIR